MTLIGAVGFAILSWRAWRDRNAEVWGPDIAWHLLKEERWQT